LSPPSGPADAFDLLDWKRRIFDLYREVRSLATSDPLAAWTRWRGARDRLFASHAQSPIPRERRQDFRGLPFFEYDPAARVAADVAEASAVHHDIGTSDGSSYGFTRLAVVRFELAGRDLALDLYWLDGYGGGLFLPFRDATSGRTSYGAGRYLLDTVKGADLGMDGRQLVLDFNFGYNPSCSYDPRWVCPLAPPSNRLAVPVEAGERSA
jgi:uncharacterized protein (DUF1684 family)